MSLGGTAKDAAIYFNSGAGEKAEEWQILSAHRNLASGSAEINRFLKQTVRAKRLELARNPPGRWRVIRPRGSDQITYGDKVICLRNHERTRWSREGGAREGYLANGEVGIVTGETAVGARPRYTKVEFASQNGEVYSFKESDFSEEGSPFLELAYAVTVHKAQGLTTQHAFLLGDDRIYRELGYVGLSRGRATNNLYVVSAEPECEELDMRESEPVDPTVELIKGLKRSRAKTLAIDASAEPGSADLSLGELYRARERLAAVSRHLPKDVSGERRDLVGRDGLEAFATELAALHQPVTVDWEARFGLTTASVPSGEPASRAPSSSTSNRGLARRSGGGVCNRCERPVSEAVVRYCAERTQEFGGRIYCMKCQPTVRARAERPLPAPPWPTVLARYRTPTRLRTLARKAPFIVVASGEDLRVMPDSSGRGRTLTRADFERAAKGFFRVGGFSGLNEKNAALIFGFGKFGKYFYSFVIKFKRRREIAFFVRVLRLVKYFNRVFIACFVLR